MNTLNEGGKGGLVMALAVIGIGLGVVGIIIGAQGKQDAKKALDEAQGAAAQVSNLAAEDQRLNFAIRDLTEQTKAAVAALEAKIPKAPPPRTNDTSRVKSGDTKGKSGDSKGKSGDHSSQAGSYTVKPNDTLGKIAKEHGVSVEAIEKANPGVDSKRLKIGQQIKIP